MAPTTRSEPFFTSSAGNVGTCSRYFPEMATIVAPLMLNFADEHFKSARYTQAAVAMLCQIARSFSQAASVGSFCIVTVRRPGGIRTSKPQGRSQAHQGLNRRK